MPEAAPTRHRWCHAAILKLLVAAAVVAVVWWLAATQPVRESKEAEYWSYMNQFGQMVARHWMEPTGEQRPPTAKEVFWRGTSVTLILAIGGWMIRAGIRLDREANQASQASRK